MYQQLFQQVKIQVYHKNIIQIPKLYVQNVQLMI
jgi:hypothetical protein